MSLPAVSSAFDSDSASPLRPAEAHALLREGFERFRRKLQELTAAAIDGTDDLFEATSHIPDGEVSHFPAEARRMAGPISRRRCRDLSSSGWPATAERDCGRTPTPPPAALRVLTPFDHEKQAALTQAARFLTRFTQREMAALDLRVGVLLEDGSARDLDNPFAIPYILDALGSTSRAVYPNPPRLAAVDGTAAGRPDAQFQRPLHRAQPAAGRPRRAAGDQGHAAGAQRTSPHRRSRSAGDVHADAARRRPADTRPTSSCRSLASAGRRARRSISTGVRAAPMPRRKASRRLRSRR